MFVKLLVSAEKSGGCSTSIHRVLVFQEGLWRRVEVISRRFQSQIIEKCRKQKRTQLE